MTLAASGAVFGSVRSHLRYRAALDDGSGGAARAEDYYHTRNLWRTYFASVWALSALDYSIRSRIEATDATPGRITLSAPSVDRSGVVWRSLLVPGAGQEFANQPKRGLFWLTGVLASAGAYVVEDHEYKRRQSDLQEARVQIVSASGTELARLGREVTRLDHNVETTKDIRSGFLATTAAFYAANVLDAITLRLSGSASATPPKVSLSVPVSPGSAQISVSCLF